MKLRMIGRFTLTIALLMLILGKESFTGNIFLKRSFQTALMSVMNLVYIISWQDKRFLVLF